MTLMHSQADQDLWVSTFFKEMNGGYFLDIGAYDGIHYSNTYYLEYHLDWKGLCVEPNPETLEKLKANRNCTIDGKAISNKKGEFAFKPDGLSGYIDDNGEIVVECITFKELFEKHNVPSRIDYMSLDIEGHEAAALSSFPFDTHHCVLITVEHNLYLGSDENKNKIYEILSNNGYIRSHEDVEHLGYKFEDWYIHKDYVNP